jgi:putative FmdB family regulatory protein
MPVYTYRCDNCGVQFERQQSYTDKSLTRCPECKKKSLKKVFQPVGIVFKGSGFYANDHKSASGGVSHKTKNENKSETKTESKVSNVGKSDSVE